MGRGRKGILNQSEKKDKKGYRGPNRLYIVEPDHDQYIYSSVDISKELLTAMKKMSPQDLKNALLQPEEEREEKEEVDLTDMEEYDLTGSGEPVYETPIMTPQLYRRIMANEFSQDQVEYIIKKALKN